MHPHQTAIKFKQNPLVQSQTDDGNGCLSPGVLNDMPFPPSVLAEFDSHVINGKLDGLIHHVSEHSFVVQTKPNSEAPLGLLHKA